MSSIINRCYHICTFRRKWCVVHNKSSGVGLTNKNTVYEDGVCVIPISTIKETDQCNNQPITHYT